MELTTKFGKGQAKGQLELRVMEGLRCRHLVTTRAALELWSDLCESPTPPSAVGVRWIAAAWLIFTLNMNVALKGTLTAESIAPKPLRYTSVEVGKCLPISAGRTESDSSSLFEVDRNSRLELSAISNGVVGRGDIGFRFNEASSSGPFTGANIVQ